MLSAVLHRYLKEIRRERELDVPFSALLSGMQFIDVVCTHSAIEKGKDFIAKSQDGTEQWVFQSKKGNLSVGELNDGILGQLFAAATTNHAHPAFDSSLPRRVVLVTTGTLTQQAADLVSSLSSGALKDLRVAPIEVWDSSKLVELFLEFGLEGIRGERISDSDFLAQGSFYKLYGEILVGDHSISDIAAHSEYWIDKTQPSEESVLRGAIEASVLASVCREVGYLYERLYLELAVFRMLAHNAIHDHNGEIPPLVELRITKQLESVVAAAEDFVLNEISKWEQSDRNLVASTRSAAMFVSYRVQASRILEALGLLVFCDDRDGKSRWRQYISELVRAEPGAAQPISDNFAVSLVCAGTALLELRDCASVIALVKSATIWLCDRSEYGIGLAGLDASAEQEIFQLLGAPFSGPNVARNQSSLIASALIELAAATGDTELYSDVWNDIKAVGLIPEYYQTQDNISQVLRIHADLRHYVGVEYRDTLVPEDYSPHSKFEPKSNLLATKFGFKALVCLSLFFRDRFFRAAWPEL